MTVTQHRDAPVRPRDATGAARTPDLARRWLVKYERGKTLENIMQDDINRVTKQLKRRLARSGQSDG